MSVVLIFEEMLKMDQKLKALAVGYSLAIVAALIMLILGIAGKLGIYTGAVEMMQKWHAFFSLSFLGIIGGMIEAAFFSFVFGYLFAWIYNKLTK